MIGACFGASIFIAITYTFKFCALAGLNIGVAQTIWCFSPALTSLLEFCIYGSRLRAYHYVGLLAMFLAGSFISLSNLFEEASVAADPVNPVPIYVPVLVSMTLPVIFATFGMYTKFVFGTKKISAMDFTFGYFLIVKGIAFIVSIWYFQSEPLDTIDYLLGFVGSILDLTGCFFANCAVSTGSPCGPIFALCDS